MPEISGTLLAKEQHILIVVSRWNDFITERLLIGAKDCFVRLGGAEECLTVIRVPGAFEIPVALRKALRAKHFSGAVALGALIQGDTKHFDLIASSVTQGVSSISGELEIPVGLGVLTTATIEQAIERSGSKAGNKGEEAMMATIEMITLFQKLK